MPTGTIGERIRTCRKGKGLSQRALASALECAQSAVCHWETDRTTPSVGTLQAIAELCEVPVAWLIGDAKPGAKPKPVQ